ncbi:MAG: serine protease [Marinicellaceae bacterium]
MKKSFTILSSTLLLIFSLNVLAKDFPTGSFIEPISEKEKNKKRIIGEANFEKIRHLEDSKKIFNTSRRVAFLLLNEQGGSCSGSLVGPDLILTNAHCVMNLQTQEKYDVTKIKVNMEYLAPNQIANFQAQVIESVKVNPNLDYALLRLNTKIGKYYGWLELADTTPTSGDVMIIQHPYGREKEISRVDSEIAQANAVVLHYYADTEPGSSGSPVFNKNGRKIIALHHAGQCRDENFDSTKGCLKFDFNEGVVIGLIKNQIKQYLPGCAIDGNFPGEFVNKCVYIEE